jgi:hypothetical protein
MKKYIQYLPVYCPPLRLIIPQTIIRTISRIINATIRPTNQGESVTRGARSE